MSCFPKTIRGKVTLLSLAATVVAAAAIVAIVAFAAQAIVRSMVADSLDDHLDKAQVAVEAGNFQAAVMFAGSDVMQVIDADGSVIASSENASGLRALAAFGDDDDAREIDDLDDLEDDDGKPKKAKSKSAAAKKPGAAGEGSSSNASASSGSGASSSSSKGSPNVSKSKKSSTSSSSKSASGTSKKKSSAKAGNSGSKKSSSGSKKSSSGSKKTTSSGSKSKSSSDDDDEDDDDENDDDDDDDDEDDDDDDDKDTKRVRAKALSDLSFPALPLLHAGTAWADGMQEDDLTVESGLPPEYAALADEGGPFLVMKRDCMSPAGPVTIAAMTSLAPAFEALQAAVQLLVVSLLVVVVLVAVFAWRLTGRTLAPVEQMRSSAEHISASDLTARIAVPEGDRDLAPLACTFNELLDRVQAALDEQKRFISDASHELKSPVAASGIILEAMREYPDSIDVDEAVGDLAGENERMRQIVSDLLALARHDEGSTSVEKAPLDLYDLLHEEADTLAARSSIAIDATGVEPVVLEADRTQLSHAVRNLLDNAARYAESTVKVACAAEGDVVRITVSDDGTGIPEADRERVFGRFVRLEDSRTRKKGSTGLGLSVVRSAVECQGGTVRFEEPELGGATAVIELPA